MWYSARFWQDVTDTECRARWNAKLAREGRGAKCRDPVQQTLSDTASADYNAHYLVPRKPRSNVHNCAGTLQNGYETPNSFKYGGGSEASFDMGEPGRGANDMWEVTDGSLFYSPTCGYFRIGQMNPMNNNSSQFACCIRNPRAAKYEGYDWRFQKRVQNRASNPRMGKSASDVDLLRAMRGLRTDVKEMKTIRRAKDGAVVAE
ncbi:unnamed protein product [Amoebophrya sp. A25]|nr:unnamed protein product [Amoebophrya sp. A25]|eukprot:GSA25T00007430001.1